jgi:hypothetical protein
LNLLTAPIISDTQSAVSKQVTYRNACWLNNCLTRCFICRHTAQLLNLSPS